MIVRNLIFIISFLIFTLPALCFAGIEDSGKYAALVVDQSSKKILYQKHAKARRVPASLIKVGTAYMLFEALEQGKINMSTKLKISEFATKQEPVSMYLKKGETISVNDAIDALIVKSANDVSVAIAEHLAGTESNFAAKMTQRLRGLGLQNTNFANSSGLPHSNNYTTAVDMVKLTMAIQRDFPQHFYRFGKTSFKFKGKTVKGHNGVLDQYPSATGLKTGFTNASGCNLITTTSSEMGSLIAVVFGGRSSLQRNQHMIGLLDQGYSSLLHDSVQSRAGSRWFADTGTARKKLGSGKGGGAGKSSQSDKYQKSHNANMHVASTTNQNGPSYNASVFDANGFKPISNKAIDALESDSDKYNGYEALQVAYGVHEGVVGYEARGIVGPLVPAFGVVAAAGASNSAFDALQAAQ